MADLRLNKPKQTDPTLEELMGGQTEAEKKPEAKKAGETNGSKCVTIYTRVGKPFDANTGKERPAQKHVVSRTWWLANKDRLSRLGYNVTKTEGE